MDPRDVAAYIERQRTRRAPCVVVLTPDDDARARESLSAALDVPRLVDVLRPFRVVDDLNVVVRADAENPQRALSVRALEVRFKSDSGATAATRDDAEARGRDAVASECFDASTMTDDACGRARRETGDACVRRARTEAETSGRFEKFFDANERATAFNECEAFDHALGAILCVRAGKSSYEEVLKSFEELKQQFLRLPVFATGGADPETCFGKVLVWDARDGTTTKEEAEALLQRVRQTGAWDCELLTLNSDLEGTCASGVDWNEHRETVISRAAAERAGVANEASKTMGRYMSLEDVERAKTYVRVFVTKTLLPHMERKLFALSTQIYNTRKGLRNQFKTFWGRSTATATAHRDGEQGYQSPEGQIRLAGDLAFMLGDYDTALANFKLVHSDYKSQSAWKRLASSYEAMAHVYVATRHLRNKADLKKDINHAYDSAMTSLLKYETIGGVGDLHLAHVEMLKVRSAVEHATALTAIGAYREAHAPLVSASAFVHSDLRAALLLERAAFAFVRCHPPMVRKFASYMILAGARYVRAGAIAAATRCYSFALPVSNEYGWSAALEHLNTTLGRLVANIGHTKAALEFFRDAVGCAAYLPADAQTVRIDALEEFAAKYASEVPAEQRNAKDDELACPLPEMNVQKVKVIFADDRESSESTSDHGEEAWSAIERGGVIPQSLLAAAPGANWLSGGPRTIEIEQTAVCASGEDVKIDVDLKNPLRVPLDVNNLRLLWEFTPSNGALVSNDRGETSDALVRAKVENEVFAPQSEQTIRLTITPSASGVLRVLGVAWTVGSKRVLHGRRYFDVSAPRTRRGADGEWLRDVTRHKRLVFNVCETVPRCDGTLEGVPKRSMDGALQRIDLVISNVTQPMAKWIRVRLPRSVLRPVDASHAPVSEPAVKRNSSREDLERDSRNRSDGDGGDDDVVDSDGVIYALPAWETLESGSTIRWPLWFHPSAVGRTAVRICVCYQPEPPAPKLLRYRTIRIFESVEVTPSMRVSAVTTPSPSHPLARVIRLSIASGREQTEIFKLGSVRLGSSKDRVKYELIPLMKHVTSSRLIAPGETIETLIKCSPSEQANAKELLNFVDAIPEESANPLFAFHNSFKKNDAKRALKVRNEAIADGLMVTWSLKGGDVVGAQHVRNVVELTRCTDTTRTPNALKSKVTWTINYASTIKLDETAPGNMTYSSVTLSARNESDDALDIVFVADATSSAPANVESGGWSLETDKNAWQNRESLPTSEDKRRRPIPLPPGKPIVWVGPVRRVAKNVAPGAVFNFPLTIACFAKGDHILDGYTLSWTETASAPSATPGSMSISSVSRATDGVRVAVPTDARNAPFIITVT